jgi:hypothetical protein
MASIIPKNWTCQSGETVLSCHSLPGPSNPFNDEEKVPLRTNADLIVGEDERNGANANRGESDQIGTASCSIHPYIASAITTTTNSKRKRSTVSSSDDDIDSKDENRNDYNDTANHDNNDIRSCSYSSTNVSNSGGTDISDGYDLSNSIGTIIKPKYANALSLANTLEITSMTTYSTTPILEQSIMQREDLSNKQKAELLFDKVKGLPCWLTDSVTCYVGCHDYYNNGTKISIHHLPCILADYSMLFVTV